MASESRIHRQRRQKLLDQLGDGLLIVPTAPQVLRNGDVHYTFRPGSDFHYLTGFPEPHAVLVAWRSAPRRHQAVLFVQPRDRQREVWDGRRHGVRGAVAHFDIDEARSIDALWEDLPELVKAHARVFHTFGRSAEFDERLFAVFRRLEDEGKRRNVPAHPVLEDPLPALGEIRLIKDAHEIATLERAAAVTAEAHVHAMRLARAGMGEFEVQAAIEEVFRRHGSPRNGYDSIVASGPNACILHYTENSRRLRRGDLLLLDAGAEVDSYTADITRTWPVSDAFSDAQRAIYRIVLRAQKAAILAVKPGRPWDAPHKASLRHITQGLLALGLLRGKVPKLIEKGACRNWFMHGTSHWLGRDVHDVGAYQDAHGKPVKLRAGMVLTVEPGLYFDPRDKKVPKEFRGIGVRIEDDVLVTRQGNRVLTAAAPKEIAEIERLRANGTAVPG